ncbi:uncharacterized protein LOC125062334 [Pieris napi]|uniref:uncharacterized protein LOC125062334 n=1 Tax=Pieris napi TaxID=78633 RepID=UPI001FBC0181|nr:uncharacterized protein LOC125062334 [Pieris napi]XP_047524129.1 uncharacterized protein LOC125062334 [Pieris napi]
MIAYLFITYVSFIHLQTTECLPRVVYLIRSDNNDFTNDFKADTWNFDDENDKNLNMLAKRNDFGNDRDVLDEIDYNVKYSDVFAKAFDYSRGNVETKTDKFETDKDGADLFKNEYEFDNNIDDVIRVSHNKKYKSKKHPLDIHDNEKLFLGKNLFKIIADVGGKLGKEIVKGIEFAVDEIAKAAFQAVPKVVYDEATKG